MRYFDHLHTVEDVKKEYKKLAFQHHPDRAGGDTATMQDVNAQYQAKLKSLNGAQSKDETGTAHTYHYNEQREQAIADKIAETLKAGIVKGDVDLYLIGSWLWCQGETKPIKEELKKLGYSWHSKRSCWYWHNDGYRHTFNSKADFDGLAAKYGATRFKSKVENEMQ